MTRCCLAPLLVIAFVAPAPALAQVEGGSPFGPLPQPQAPPPEQPEPQPADFDSGDDDGLGGGAFWLIIGTTGAIFAVIGFFIVRDMRRTVRKPGQKRRRLRGTGRPAVDAAQALAEDGRHRPGSQKARAKAQQRAKTKAARKQRRKTRSR
jgi:predicted lipid-binding transport protein (Tim44 family)